MTERPICVIIAAHNAQATIGDAVRTALIQPQVAEVILVDDASGDQTGAAAQAAAGPDDRLIVLRQARNQGPGAARNRALLHTKLPLVAVLDADDYLVPGRFARLLAEPSWDLIADNIQFVLDTAPDLLTRTEVPVADDAVITLDLPTFIKGNMRKRNKRRGELGFLKPVMSRDFLLQHGLSYNRELWLGEDFDIYVRMLAKGARFKVSRQIGYVARVRENSLSGQHKTRDLRALLHASEKALRAAPAAVQRHSVVSRYLGDLRQRYLLREFLDLKAAQGPGAALRFALSPPSHLLPIARGVLSDKLTMLVGKQEVSPVGGSLLPIQSDVPIT